MNAFVDRQIAIDADADTELPSQDALERWLGHVLERESTTRRELTVRLVEPAESQTLNREYRHKDKPTNVLSFPFEVPPGVELDLLGDLIICHDVVVEEARTQGKALMDHYAHLVIHGCLHLLGYDHIDDEQAEEMESKERALLAHFGIDDPYRPADACDDP